jgi:hypothetical protein
VSNASAEEESKAKGGACTCARSAIKNWQPKHLTVQYVYVTRGSRSARTTNWAKEMSEVYANEKGKEECMFAPSARKRTRKRMREIEVWGENA